MGEIKIDQEKLEEWISKLSELSKNIDEFNQSKIQDSHSKFINELSIDLEAFYEAIESDSDNLNAISDAIDNINQISELDDNISLKLN